MTIYVVDLESVQSRYTCEWKEHLPRQLNRSTNETVEVISGGDTPQATTPGAFLNFGGTNVYKSRQLEIIGEKFCKGIIKDNDYFLYTDAWNPTVIQLKYMSSLLGIDIRIGGLWHAGSYDKNDFLGRLIGDEDWIRNAEASMFYAYDDNFFATDFHINMFVETLFDEDNIEDFKDCHLGKIHRVGWPMEYLKDSLIQYKDVEKENLVLFPHRIAPEKQIDIFYDLKQQLPEYEFVVCQEQNLSKNDYHNLLSRAKVVFSANLQETLGISWYEGVLVDAIPMVPDRLSYKEMALPEFKYPSTWTEDFSTYRTHRGKIVDKLRNYIENYNDYLVSLEKQRLKLNKNFFSGKELYEVIRNG